MLKIQKTLSLCDKIDLLNKNQSSKMTQVEIASRLNIPRSTLQKLIKNEKSLKAQSSSSSSMNKQKRKRLGKAPKVEESLLLWFKKATSRGLLVSRPILIEFS